MPTLPLAEPYMRLEYILCPFRGLPVNTGYNALLAHQLNWMACMFGIPPGAYVKHFQHLRHLVWGLIENFNSYGIPPGASSWSPFGIRMQAIWHPLSARLAFIHVEPVWHPFGTRLASVWNLFGILSMRVWFSFMRNPFGIPSEPIWHPCGFRLAPT